MNSKTLSPSALSVIDQYINFSIGGAVCSIPYFNNKTANLRHALRTHIGKGSPKEIRDEVTSILVKNHVSIETLVSESLKKLIVDNKIGIDCSALVYYILNAESEANGSGSLKKHISFVNRNGLFGKIRAKLRPVENCGVSTLADDKNSSVVELKDIQPGDMITMIGGPDNNDRDHNLVVHRVDYENSIPVVIYYTHAVAYPEDGLYGTGVRQGKIELTNAGENILEAGWEENQMLERARKSKTEIRRIA